MDSLKKLLSNWTYRYMTPYGKVTILRSLALSKLSHIALVIPNPSKTMIKHLETTMYNFLWNNKSEKVCRNDAKLPENLGGLNVPNVENFWTAFKFSWVRRMLHTKSFWPQLIQHQINVQLGYEISLPEILELGPSLIEAIGKNMKNKFWKETFQSITTVTNAYLYRYPERFTRSSFWYNPLIKRNNKIIKLNDFPEISKKVCCVGDFLCPHTNTLMTYQCFLNKYSIHISEDRYIDIRYIIQLALQKIGFPFNKIDTICYPNRPLIIEISAMTMKGCAKYSQLLNYKSNISNKVYRRDERWHQELQLIYSTNFWEKTRILCASMLYENPVKWLQYQIIRNSLQTNYIVSHFKASVSPLCTFCQSNDEKISHLFWLCPKTSEFLEEVFELVNSTDLHFSPNMSEFLFGYLNKDSNDPVNYISLHLKKFIWTSKFRNKVLNFVGFRYYFKNVLTELKVLLEIREKKNNFNVWVELYNVL